jgi:hypothetical protein
MRLFQSLKDFLAPNARNAYRPGILGKGPLLFFVAVTLVAEGFLVANLVGRHSFGDFVAAVISSEIISLTNVERASAAMPSLAENSVLSQAAQAKAEHMAAFSYFAHVGPDGKQPWAWIAEAGYDYRVAGENLAVRFVDSSDVVEAWMASPTHRENIVKSSYEEIGIGIAHGTYKGSPATFVVQFFGTPRAIAAVTPSVPEAVQSTAPAAAPQASPEVAGESINTPAAAAEASVGGKQDGVLKTLGRALAEPRAATGFVLGMVAGLLLAAVAVAFFINFQVQPTDMLLKGSLVAGFALLLIGVNAHGLGGSLNPGGQAAAVASGWERQTASGVVISAAGESSERFIVEI